MKVNLIVGAKGSGKTNRLVDDLNNMASNDENNVVCILRGDRLNPYVKHQIRIIDVDEYPVDNYGETLAFIAGLNAKDYDISHIYIDSIGKIAGNDQEELAKFLAALEGMAEKNHFEAEIIFSCPEEDVIDSVKQYVS